MSGPAPGQTSASESGPTKSFVLSSSLLLRPGGMALTTPEESPLQPHVGSMVNSGDSDPNSSPNRTVTIGNLPVEVLLEIFDHYRESFSSLSLRVWCNKNGWFKLAHVCHKWRCIVFASSRRLVLLLFFGESTPTRAALLKSQSLSQLPILVDYSRIVWNAGAQTRLISALRYPNRVLRIAINGSRKNFDKICKALDLPFPALVSLELHNMEGDVDVEPILRASSLMTSITSLQHLRLANVRLSSLLPLLSVTRALLILDLTVDTLFWQPGGASLLTHLQHIPHLRELQVSTQSTLYTRKPPITTVSLAELSHFHFSGRCTEIEWFVAGLTTPPLQELHISVVEFFRTLHIPHLSKFIHVAGIIFSAARLSFLGSSNLATSMFAPPYSTRTVTFTTPSNAHLGSALSPMLATITDVFLCIPTPLAFHGPLLRDLVHWRKFFEELRKVKVLRLHHGLEREVAHMLRLPTVNPSSPAQEEVDPDATTTPSSGPTINSSSRSLFNLDIFPSLENIVVYARTPDSSIDQDELASGLVSFTEYGSARKRVGRPVNVLLNLTGQLPWIYTLPDVGA
ncbi:hypothetical protein F5888DRAFT_1809251 [Russula emetica]|nr:hypothetical protein F5888DRAFT_1809251 [Russula emetica]